MSFSSEKNVSLIYNTLNTKRSKRKIIITYEKETIIAKESNFQKEFNLGRINIIVENFSQENDINIQRQDFSLILKSVKKIIIIIIILLILKSINQNYII